MGIGTGDINVAVEIDTGRIDAALPIGHLLDLVKEEIGLAGDRCNTSAEFLIESSCIAEFGIRKRLKVEGDEVVIRNTLASQFILDQIKHDRFAGSAHSRQDFDQFVPDKRPNALYVLFTWNHVLTAFLWKSVKSIAYL